MIKRDKRNIGKLVRVIPHGTRSDGRLGKVMGFRGDRSKGNPFVSVFIYNLTDRTKGAIFPFPGNKLEIVRASKVK